MTNKIYRNNLEYLDDEIQLFLPIRFQRMDSDKEDQQQQDLKSQEEQIREQIDAKLNMTRKKHGDFFLGLDVLVGCVNFPIRLLLLVLLAVTLGFDEKIFKDFLFPKGNSLSALDVIQTLGLESIKDRLGFRELVQDLAKQGILELETSHSRYRTSDFNNMQISLSQQAYEVMLGLSTQDNFGTQHSAGCPYCGNRDLDSLGMDRKGQVIVCEKCGWRVENGAH